jgi:hypothetical protein
MGQFFEKFKIIELSFDAAIDSRTSSVFVGEKENVRVEQAGENSFEISGLRDDVDKMKVDIENGIKELEAKRKSEPKEAEAAPVVEAKVDDDRPVIENLQLHQIRMLLMLKYRTEMKDKFPNLKVTVETKDLKIKYEGNADEIKEAKSIANGVFKAIKSKAFTLELIRIRFLLKNETSLVRWLNESKFICVIEFSEANENCVIYSTKGDDIQKCFNMLQQYVVVKTYVFSEHDSEDVDRFVANENAKLLWSGDTKTTNYSIEKGDHSTVLICGYPKFLEPISKSLEKEIKVTLLS